MNRPDRNNPSRETAMNREYSLEIIGDDCFIRNKEPMLRRKSSYANASSFADLNKEEAQKLVKRILKTGR
jgi:hypothetical protein